MLEILEFVFSGFWVFCGVVILIYVTGMSVAMIVGAATGGSNHFSVVSKTEKGEVKGNERETHTDN